MNVLYFLFLLPLVAYSVQIVSWYIIWIRTDDFIPEERSVKDISVIIPFKDESRHLPALIHSLNRQSHQNWELVLINDHSEDDSLCLLNQLLQQFSHPYKLINATGHGKKTALQEGVNAVLNPVVVTTDADCTFHPDWLATLSSYYQLHQPDLLIGPVGIRNSKGLLSRFQAIDFAALQISGGAAALAKQPIMCNGANLMCRKDLYQSTNLQTEIASGDDMFLLEWLKEQGKEIHYIKSNKALVETESITSLKDFIQQRARWAAKAPKYKDKQIIRTGLTIALSNFIIVLCLVFSIWLPDFIKVFLFLLTVKSLCDFILLKAGSRTFRISISLLEVLIWQLFYPFYSLSVLVYPLFFKLKWKSRAIG